MTPRRVVIVGGGAIGASVALFLRRLGGAEVAVTVVERDLTLALASSSRSAASIRQQFSTALNVQMSRFGFELIADPQTWLAVDDAPVDLGLVESGYLVLADTADAADTLRQRHVLQRAEGADVALLSAADCAARFAWLRSDDLALSSLGLAREGWFDGEALARAMARKAQALGAVWRRANVVGFSRTPGQRVDTVQLDDGDALPADVVVNAAGPWAGALARLAGLALPVFARRRTVFALRCACALPRTPLVVDPSGVWFRSDFGPAEAGDRFIAGWSPGPGDADPDDLPLDQPDLAQFEDRLWPALAQRVPAFEAMRVVGAWDGYYEVHPQDQNALIGPHPDCANFIGVNGFSGHGLQHAPAAGRGVAEWILTGGYRSLDLSPLGFERLGSGQQRVERAII